MNEPARNVYRGSNRASGMTNVGSMVASGQLRGRSYAKGGEERDSGTTPTGPMLLRKRALRQPSARGNNDDLAQHYA